MLASAALVLSAPFMGQMRTWRGNVFARSFVTFTAGAIGTAVAAASACVILSVACFVDQIHLGHEVVAEATDGRTRSVTRPGVPPPGLP